MKNITNKQLTLRTQLLMQKFFDIYTKKIKKIRAEQEMIKNNIQKRKNK